MRHSKGSSTGKRLFLSLLFLLIVLGVCGVLSYLQLQQIEHALNPPSAAGPSSENAALALQLKTSQSARVVVDYVRTLESKYSTQLQQTHKDIETQLPLLQNTATTATLQAEYQQFVQLGNQITKLAYEQYNTLQLFRLDSRKLNTIINKQLLPRIVKSSAAGMDQMESAVKMQTDINQAYGAIEAYLSLQDPNIQKQFKSSSADFKKYFDLFQSTPIGSKEESILHEMDGTFQELLEVGRSVISVTDQIKTLLGQFEQVHEKIETQLSSQSSSNPVERADNHSGSVITSVQILSLLGFAGIFLVGLGLALTLAKGGSSSDSSEDVKQRDALEAQVQTLTQKLTQKEELQDQLNALQDELAQKDTALQKLKDKASATVSAPAPKSQASVPSMEWISAQEAHQIRSKFLGELSTELYHITQNKQKFKLDSKDQFLKYFNYLSESSERLLNLLNQLLELFSMEVGPVVLELQSNDLKTVMDTVIQETGELLNVRSLELKIQPSGENTRGIFDGAKILQVVYHLLINAVDCSPKQGKILVSYGQTVLQRKGEDSIPGLGVTISDQGRSIPEMEQASLFEKFSASAQARLNSNGSGLGLALCKAVVTAHGGSIWAENEPNGGATFTFVIPSTPQG
ncbi:ATP-binding protein [Deltaproteobacteria bacterium TL4]